VSSFVTCPHCGKRLLANQEHSGKRVKCASCKKELRIPILKQGNAIQNQVAPSKRASEEGSSPPPAPPPRTPLMPPSPEALTLNSSRPIGFRCPFCQSPNPPIVREEVSTAGWICLVILLLTCFPFFWIGLLVKTNYRVCSSCGIKLG
jgi:DNA-directed RNA polymerase subunit M/transcription elongation factor TFIIS